MRQIFLFSFVQIDLFTNFKYNNQEVNRVEYYEILKQEREKRNLTMKQVAEDNNILPDTYRKYERGVSEPDLKTLVKLCKYFYLSMDYLCGLYERKE